MRQVTRTLLVLGLLTLVALAGSAWYVLGVPGRAHSGPLPPATADEKVLAKLLRSHVEAIANEPRNTTHPDGLKRAANYIETSLRALGYTPQSQYFDASGHRVRNIEVIVPASGIARNLPILFIGAHYDSAFDSPGANDNGTGTAAVLELARLLKEAKPSAVEMRFVLFVNEEPPYFRTQHMGSVHYAESIKAQGLPVRGMISLETIGAFSDEPGSQRYPEPFGRVLPSEANFVAFVGMPGSRGFVHEVMASFRTHTAFPTVGGVAPGHVPGIAWSDHASFAELGFPAMMITDTAIYRYAHYHKRSDTPDKIDYDKLARITKGLERTVRELAR